MQRHWRKLVLFLCSLILCLGLNQACVLNRSLSVNAAQVTADQFVQQGIDRYQAGEFRSAIELWQTALTQYQNDRENTAIVVENIARAYQQLGQRELEIEYWQRAIALNRQLGESKHVAQLLTEIAQTYARSGQPKTAIALLCNGNESNTCTSESALSLARKTHDPTTEAAALGSLGEAYRLTGNYTTAIAFLQSGLERAQHQPAYEQSVFMSLGSTHSSLARVQYRRAESAEQRGDTVEAERLRQLGRTEDQTALSYFQKSLTIAQTLNDAKAQVRALLSTIPAQYRLNNINAANTALQQAATQLTTLPKSRDRVYAAIELARLLQPSHESAFQTACLAPNLVEKAQTLLQSAVTIAAQIQDQRASSFALGELGHLYECRGDYAQALALTEKARWAAEQHLNAKDSLYLWEWQTGRILKAQGDRLGAISLYDRAIATLDDIRSDILTADRDVRFDFRDTVEPVYRELISLRLESELLTQNNKSGKSISVKPDNDNLTATLKAMDSLRLSELQNYFGNDCVLTVTTPENRIQPSLDQSTATFSSILLNDRLAIVLSLPNHRNRIAFVDVSLSQIRQEVNGFRRGLERFYDDYDPSQAQKLYDWIVRPFEAELAPIKTLVFVQDGILRTIPMAALYDGQKFLIQRYAIATTPSLQLTEFKAFDRQNLRALALGLTQRATVDGRQFQALANVTEEIREVETQIPGSKQLLDQNFTRDQLQQELKQHDYSIIHIATHGEFAADPENTFLVMGNNQKLTLNELDRLIRSTTSRQETIELLTLTACQTAAGDDRAALGLAGVAVQAGAKSAIASLWFINDAATAKLATDLYFHLHQPNTTKAQALQTAQLALIESGGQFSHPAYWAPFVLVGNWQ
jgi:CHAT domain-containing protein